MTFASFDFLIFFGLVLVAYYAIQAWGGHRAQNVLLLVASYVFYGWWDWRFLGLLLFSTVVDYFCARGLDPDRSPARSLLGRRAILLTSIASNLGILSLFKYFNFFRESLASLASILGMSLDWPTLHIILPVGISFYTFQTLGYTIDVYRGKLGPARRIVDFMLYVSFFPQLVAGPIERASRLLPQVTAPRRASREGLFSGAQLALVGYFKKVVLADSMAVLVNDVFLDPHPGAGAITIAIYAFALQIYCDFSGYTDIARGTARMLGFDLMENFRLPYLATSPRDFWARWHISLSTWLRDYLYIPLGGNRKGKWRTRLNLMTTMILGGLWHGAAWHFVAWGVYHGGLLVGFRSAGRDAKGRPSPKRGWRFALAAGLFFQLTCIGWLIFRVESLSQLMSFAAAFAHPTDLSLALLSDALPVLAIAVPLLAFQVHQHQRGQAEVWLTWSPWLRTAFNVALYFGITLFAAGVHNEFIYFQF